MRRREQTALLTRGVDRFPLLGHRRDDRLRGAPGHVLQLRLRGRRRLSPVNIVERLGQRGGSQEGGVRTHRRARGCRRRLVQRVELPAAKTPCFLEKLGLSPLAVCRTSKLSAGHGAQGQRLFLAEHFPPLLRLFFLFFSLSSSSPKKKQEKKRRKNNARSIDRLTQTEHACSSSNARALTKIDERHEPVLRFQKEENKVPPGYNLYTLVPSNIQKLIHVRV